MTTAIELHESRGASDSAGKVTASRRFAIWDEAAELTSPAQVRGTFGTTAGSTVIPQVGDLFPDETDIYCISYSIKRQPHSRGVWEVDFSYENTEVGSLQPAQQATSSSPLTGLRSSATYGAPVPDLCSRRRVTRPENRSASEHQSTLLANRCRFFGTSRRWS